MDDRRFDALARSLAAGASRRLVLKGLLGGLIGGVALGSAGKTFAQDEEPPVEETDPTLEPVVEEVPPADETVTEGDPPPAEEPPAEEPPAEEPPAEELPAEEPLTEPAVEQVDEGTPSDPAGLPEPVVCGDGWTPCEGGCCEPGWRCCGVYCIPDREGACCGDAECGSCHICSLDGLCYPVCEAVGLECCVDEANHTFTCANCCTGDPSCDVVIDCDFCESIDQECCVDDKHDRIICAHCCDHSDCARYGSCHQCYGGYCLDCYDQTDGRERICAIDECGGTVSVAGGSGGYCVESCGEDCGPCERYHDGRCESVCGHDEHCCEGDLAAAGLINGGYCASCCSSEHCSGCERCDDGTCAYACDKDETCCHDTYCAPHSEGCCGVPGDWCEVVTAADGLSGYCCDGLHCCWDDKSGSGSCAECCDHYDCPEDWRCCGGTCSPECCHDKDCSGGFCVDGYCSQCRENHDCGHGEICCLGECRGDIECCYEYGPDPVNCSECETCTDGYCRPTGVSLYGACNPMGPAPAFADTPQLNCCDGLVCCDTHAYGLVCVECCGDQDCAHGCSCEDGFCSCGCSSDKDCADGTCCCKNGSCSADCCPTPKPPKPPAPPKPASGTTTVTTLPATGSGDSKEGSGLLGAAALGAAAAFLASRKLKADQTPEASTPKG